MMKIIFIMWIDFVIDKTWSSLTLDKEALSSNLRRIVYKFASAKLILREHAGLMRGRDLYAKRSIPYTCIT